MAEADKHNIVDPTHTGAEKGAGNGVAGRKTRRECQPVRRLLRQGEDENIDVEELNEEMEELSRRCGLARL